MGTGTLCFRKMWQYKLLYGKGYKTQYQTHKSLVIHFNLQSSKFFCILGIHEHVFVVFFLFLSYKWKNVQTWNGVYYIIWIDDNFHYTKTLVTICHETIKIWLCFKCVVFNFELFLFLEGIQKAYCTGNLIFSVCEYFLGYLDSNKSLNISTVFVCSSSMCLIIPNSISSCHAQPMVNPLRHISPPRARLSSPYSHIHQTCCYCA